MNATRIGGRDFFELKKQTLKPFLQVDQKTKLAFKGLENPQLTYRQRIGDDSATKFNRLPNISMSRDVSQRSTKSFALNTIRSNALPSDKFPL